MDIIQKRLEEDSSLPERTNLKVDDIMELLRFIMSTTYFTFRGKIYEQVFGTAMGSPVSVVVANLYMEDLEQRALATAPMAIRPRLWVRYVDDAYEIAPKDSVEKFTNHLNKIDETGSIKFTYEVEADGKLPMLDAMVTRQSCGKLRLSIYRKKTHTDQYLSFKSHHPLHHKLGVVRTLLDRSDTIITHEADKQKEEEHIKGALKLCGYPGWTIKQVKQQKSHKAEKKASRPDKSQSQRPTGSIVILYVAGLSESYARILKKYNIQTAMKPALTLRQCLVHPKDKRPLGDTVEAVYKISCKQCPKTYVGETGRKLSVRLKEHREDVEKASQAIYTRSQRKASETTFHKSALSDHATQSNHLIDWDSTKVVGRESNRQRRWIREAIRIRQEGKRSLNRDGGNTELPRIWDPLINSTAPPGGERCRSNQF